MNRRHLLKTLGGTGLSYSLSSILSQSALSQDDRPIRCLFIYHPNGCVPNIFHPQAGSLELPAMTAPLESVKQHCVFLDGFGLDGEGGTHEGGGAKVLTGNHASKDNMRATSSSIEIMMGEENFSKGFNPIAPSIQMGLFASKWSNHTISFQDSIRLPYFDDPLALYDNLFGNPSNSSTDQSNLAAFNAAYADLRRLESQLNGIEAERLQMHTQSFAVLEAKLNALANDLAGNCRVLDLSDIGSEDWKNEQPDGPMARISDAQQDIAVQALSCDITRAISFMYSHPVSPIENPTGGMGDHDASHSDADTHLTSKVWWMQEIANFIQKLADMPDGPTSSLLDNTIVFLVSELGHGNWHDHWRMPFVLAGGKNTGLQTGRSLDFRGVGTQTYGWSNEIGQGHANLLQLIARRAGYSFDIPLATGETQGIW